MTDMTTTPLGSTERLGGKEIAGLLVALLLILTPGFFTIPTMDRDEARYAQASVQMLETGDFIDIRFQDQARHVKPAGIYWLQTITATPFGGEDAPIWAFRLPSLLGVIIASLATAFLGARIGGRQVGLIAGLVVGITLAAAVEARTAKTDAMLLATAAVAQSALYFMLTTPKGSPAPKFVGAPLVFWLASGAAIMIKGPIITMVSAATIAAYGLWTRDWGVIKRLRLPLGLLVAAALAAPWLIAINIRTEGAFIQEAVGHALFGKVAESDDSHAGPFGYHTLLLPVTMWPGVLLVGLGVAAAWMRRAEPTVRFLLCWIIPTWLIFELVATKLPHYVLPTFPAIALLAAIGVQDSSALLSRGWVKALHWVFAVLFALVALVLGVAPAVLTSELGGEPFTPVNMIPAVTLIITALAGVFWALRPQMNRLVIVAVGALLSYWTVFEGAVPRVPGLWPSHDVAAVADRLTGCEQLTVATAGYREPSNVFYLGANTVLEDGAEAADILLQDPECGLAVVETAQRAEFDAAIIAAGAGVRSVGRVEGMNMVKGDPLDMELFVNASGNLQLTE